MKYLPLFHNLRGSRVLVVGGGEIALRKSRLLADAGALLRVVAPEIETQLAELVAASGGECLLRGYAETDLDGCGLIIAATDDETLNAQVSTDAHRRCVPVNVVDAPTLCSVIFPAIVDRSPLIIAVSSGGDAPVLARLIRAKIETWIPSTYGQLAGLAARFRNQVKNLFPDVQQRRGFWEDVFQGPIADRQLAGQGAEAERLLQAKVDGEPMVTTGEVYLVGAGPGDPGLGHQTEAGITAATCRRVHRRPGSRPARAPIWCGRAPGQGPPACRSPPRSPRTRRAARVGGCRDLGCNESPPRLPDHPAALPYAPVAPARQILYEPTQAAALDGRRAPAADTTSRPAETAGRAVRRDDHLEHGPDPVVRAGS